jgi:NADH-ubiquinone oxidoreductase chain 5
MEGPTPVSALIHAATMVTAGVFLIIRCSHIFEYAPKVLIYMTFFGSITSFFSATVGLTQTDIKKVIAYSTCSQLGYMIFICGLSKYTLSLYHLGNHAFFKALLFLSAGSIIHAVNDEQNMYKLGGLRTQLPFIYSVMVLGSLALGGLPFLSGFYSKDLILEIIYLSHCFNFNGFFSFIFGITSACFTGIYSVRLLENTFFYQTKLPYKVISNIHETTFSM